MYGFLGEIEIGSCGTGWYGINWVDLGTDWDG